MGPTGLRPKRTAGRVSRPFVSYGLRWSAAQYFIRKNRIGSVTRRR